MPATRPSRPQNRPRRFNYRKLPLWLQWGLPLATAAGLIVALVIWVNYETNDVPSEAGVNSPTAIVEQNQQDDATMRQMQAPQTSTLPSGLAPAVALEHVISKWLDNQISHGFMNGPLTSARCHPTAGSTATRAAFSCSMVTANVTYPFYGVVVPASHQVTYCRKIAYPPVYGMPRLKLSKRCLAS